MSFKEFKIEGCNQLANAINQNPNTFWAIIPDDQEIWETTQCTHGCSIHYITDNEDDWVFHIYYNEEIFFNDYKTNLDAFSRTIRDGIYKYDGFGDDSYYDYLPSQVTSLAWGYYFLSKHYLELVPAMVDIKNTLTDIIQQFLDWDANEESDPLVRKEFQSSLEMIQNPSQLPNYTPGAMPDSLILKIYNKSC